MSVTADDPSCVAPDRVFPPFGDEALLLACLLGDVEGRRVVDVGTGSGILALVAASRGAFAVGIDVNRLALACAKSNAMTNRLEHRVAWCEGDLLEPVRTASFDMVVADPPFLPTPPGTRLFLSSDGGPFGVAAIERLVPRARSVLRPGGRMLLLALALGNEKTTLVESLCHRAFGGSGDAVYVHDVYGVSQPASVLTDCYSGWPGVDPWRRMLEERRLDRIRFLLIEAWRETGFCKPAQLPTLNRDAYSGSWAGRIARYQSWLSTLTACHHERPAAKSKPRSLRHRRG